jgi:hypothetical protein
MKVLSGGMFAAFAAFVVLQVAPAGARDARWQMAKPLSQPLGEIVGAVVGKKWYVMGGYDGLNVQAQGVIFMVSAMTRRSLTGTLINRPDNQRFKFPAGSLAGKAIMNFI